MAPHVVGRGVLLDVGRSSAPRTGELPDGFAITADHLDRDIAEAHGVTRRPGRHLVLVRTGQLRPRPPRRLGRLRGRTGPGAVASAPPAGCTAARSPGSPPTPGASRCGPTSSTTPSSRCTRSCIPNIGLLIGEMWDLDALAADCAADGRYEFWLTAAPLPITGAVGSPVNPIAVK